MQRDPTQGSLATVGFSVTKRKSHMFTLLVKNSRICFCLSLKDASYKQDVSFGYLENFL